MDPDFKAGMERAAESIDSGRALRKLEDLIALSRSFAPFMRRELR
jgi:anthranilate phosphoribosyltransferase